MWSQEIKTILDKIRLNSIKLSSKHRTTALSYQHIAQYFDMPVIILSTISSSLGSNSLIADNDKASINLFISMTITILTSIKLYLNITSNLNQEIQLSRDYYVLSIDIYKNLNLPIESRPDAQQYLNECYSQYVKLIEQSTLNNKIKKDELLKVETSNDNDDIETMSSSSSSYSLQTLDSPIRRNIIITETDEV
jgi:hypothetical protein